MDTRTHARTRTWAHSVLPCHHILGNGVAFQGLEPREKAEGRRHEEEEEEPRTEGGGRGRELSAGSAWLHLTCIEARPS